MHRGVERAVVDVMIVCDTVIRAYEFTEQILVVALDQNDFIPLHLSQDEVLHFHSFFPAVEAVAAYDQLVRLWIREEAGFV